MKKALFVALVLLAGIAVQAQITAYPYSQGFENGFDGWTSVSNNADNSWSYTTD